MLKLEFTGQFKKDFKRAIKRDCDPKKLEKIVTLLCEEKALPAENRDHALVNSRNYKNMRRSGLAFGLSSCSGSVDIETDSNWFT